MKVRLAAAADIVRGAQVREHEKQTNKQINNHRKKKQRQATPAGVPVFLFS